MSETGHAQSTAPEQERDPEAAPAQSAPPSWLLELREAASSLRELVSAQIALLGAEFRLARSAARVAMLAMLAATVFAVALGLTVLALLGWALAQWFGSWLWALLALAVLQGVGLVGAIVLFRRCLHWMSLPRSRAQVSALVQESTRSGEAKDHGSDQQPG